MSTQSPSIAEQLEAWHRLEQHLGVHGPDEILEMIRSLEAQLIALYADLDASDPGGDR